MNKYITSWLAAAAELLESELSRPVDLLPGAAIDPAAGTFTLMVDIAGDWCGTFTLTAEEAALRGVLGEPVERATDGKDGGEAVREAWQAVFGRICLAAAADLGIKSGLACEVAMISPDPSPVDVGGMGYQLRAGERMVPLLIADLVEAAEVAPSRTAQSLPSHPVESVAAPVRYAGGRTEPDAAGTPGETAGGRLGVMTDAVPGAPLAEPGAMKGVELLLDIELEASLRFGSREMALSDLLALGPGDVVQLDRALTDPVDLLIGDKIVARGEVVLVNGNFGLQVTEVAEPRKTLESIRCLF